MGLNEECGVFAIYDSNGNCARSTYYGLYALQHRGQEDCGIATINNLELSCHKGTGLVGERFSEHILTELNGTMAIGHVRYGSANSLHLENAQPLTLTYIKGSLAVAHNGKLINSAELKREYEYKGAVFHTTTDSEVIAYIIAQARLHSGSAEAAVNQAVKRLKGAYSLVVMSSRKLIAARDPWGFRPMCIGRKGDAIIFASESCALDSIEATFVRDIDPGEIVWVENGQLFSNRENCTNDTSLCIFELLYFARPDSVIDGQSVYDARINAGKCLAKDYPINADVVIGVPDSGLVAAKGYSIESGIPYNDGFIKNRYIGRTFIKPAQSTREEEVKIKLNPLRATVNGKSVVMIDDSIVRGTTMIQIARLLREAGAKEIHVLSSAPKFISQCFFGTDIPTKDNLFACNYTTEEMRSILGVDSLGFLNTKSLAAIAPDSKCSFCDACFTENYPMLHSNET
ncbi:MAG: amidophosphoribosyltransferase [Oscillospiraceae bacterium]|nr:amidophosphoribosyltransferase [Oscillospiraceae bacterium]